MRWKEQCFLNTGEDCGLTIAGFYYICMSRRTGEVHGKSRERSSTVALSVCAAVPDSADVLFHLDLRGCLGCTSLSCVALRNLCGPTVNSQPPPFTAALYTGSGWVSDILCFSISIGDAGVSIAQGNMDCSSVLLSALSKL